MFGEQQMKYFVSLGDSLSFSRTAAEHQVSRQAVSKSVSALERQLGLKLLKRDGQNVSLTKAGRLMLDFFTEELSRLDALQERLRGLRAGVSDSLAVGFQDYLSFEAEMPRGFQSGTAGRRNISIEVKRYTPGVLLHYLQSERLDIIVMCKRFVSGFESLEARELKKTPLYLLVSADNPKAVPGAGAADFMREPLIMDRLEGEREPEFKLRVRGYIAHCSLAPSAVIEAPNLDSAYLAVTMGKGVLICPSSSRFLNTAGVRAYDTGAEDIFLCLWRKHDGNPIVREYAAYLLDRYAADGGGPE